MTFKQTTAVLPLLALLACAPAGNIDKDPEVSAMGDAQAMPEATMINVPMPEVVPRPAPQRAENASLWQSGRETFFADRRAGQVGDIVTITIAVDDGAQMRNSASRSRQGETSLKTPSVLGYAPKLGPTGEMMSLRGQTSNSGTGQIARTERINVKVAALVIQRLPNGNLVVAGRQEIKVNEEVRELRVAGIIKPGDIGSDNSISYEKIAEARITYGGRGQISRQTRSAYGEEAMNVLLPY